MPLPLAIAGAVIGTVGLISNFIGSKKAASAAKDSAAEEARIMKLTTAERLRQLKTEERVMRGETLSGYARGGVLATAPTLDGQMRDQTGSPATVLGEQAREFAAERKITQQVGASNVQQALMRGKNTANAYKWQGYSNAASGISSLLTNYQMNKGP